MQRPPLPLEDSPLKCGSRAARHPPASLPVGGSKCNMPSSLGCLLLCGSIALALGNAQKLPKGKKPSLKVHINTTSDSILLKFLRPNPNVKLEGFLLGYGSNVSPNQYFPLPTEGKYAEAVVDAEPKYLIVVRPVPPPSQKKSCSGKTRARKPLQLVVGTLSPSSVFLSWGFLINPHHDWTLPSHCPNDRLYTIRYREKDKEKKWIFQLCPATETIVDNLKPNTVYEFGVKDNVEGGIWSKIFNHKTIVGSKNKVNGKIQSTYDQVHTVPAYIPRKLIPVTIIKQVIQNVTHRASTKSPDKTPFGGTILVHFIIPGLNDTSAKLPPSIMLEISDALKAQLAKNETLALPVESKTLEVDKITAQHITVTPETVPRTTKPTMSSTPDISQTALVLSQRTQETLQTILLPKFELPRSTPAPKGLLEFPEAKTSFPFEKFGVTSVTSEKSWMAPAAKTLGDSGVVKPHTAPGPQTLPPPQPTKALRQTPRTTPKTKTSQHPRIPQTQPVPKGPPRATSRPKTSPSPEVSHTTYGPEDVPFPHEQDPDVSQSEPVLQPVTFRIEPPKTTTAPSETRGIPLIPIISPSLSQEELLPTFEETDQTTQELFTTKIPQELFTTKIPQTTELAKTTQAPRRLYTIPVRPRIPDRPPVRPVLNRTTTKPIRPRPSGIPSRNGVGTGPKQGPKPSGPVRNVSVDSTQATKRPATIPGTRRPPLPPRPVPPRRKPLPPNNVTGKPGSSGIISSHRVTSPPLKATLKPTLTTSERPETDKKQPTAPASGEEFGNTTDFSSSPTRETDHLGKPRFKGPHVRYIPKPESKPCSITDSVQRFPTEEAMEGHATSPPQNPPTNLTVVTVEGCPSFVILDWEKPLNDTVTEYEVISRENGSFSGKNKSIQVTNQTFSTVENLKPDTSYEFQVKPKNPLGEGPASNTVAFSTESADPRVSEPVSAGRDAIWTERPFNSDSYSECKGKQYVKRTWYKKFVGVQLCNSLRYKIYLSDSLTGQFYNIGDQRGHGEDHCQFVDSFLDGRTGQHLSPDQLPTKEGYFRAVRQEPVQFGEIGGHTQINYVQWYECGTTIPGKW
ncbi:PREDICTED: target of Nesh-SH3 isoform X24 [Chinchilla lanigera]|uniref:target of Nesh-SH3 isoform X24 n=1 Tax=Chinchilla lanigera TaxID=34839 RepID=UPI00069836CA|nr:PREDICTED: target of Nesh-SH3 isoform X24 [Chinchilla lanigera]